MTIQEVKRDLPDVPVRVGRKVLWAKVSGRLNTFATVTLSHTNNGGKSYLRGPAWVDKHFSWEAVARAVSTGKPLNFDD